MLSFLANWLKGKFSKENKESMDKNSDFPVLIDGEEIIFSLVDFDEAVLDNNTKVSIFAFVFILKNIRKINRFARDKELDAFLESYHDKIKDCGLIIALGDHDRTGRGYIFEEDIKMSVPTGDFIFSAAKYTKRGLEKCEYIFEKLPPKGTLYLVIC